MDCVGTRAITIKIDQDASTDSINHIYNTSSHSNIHRHNRQGMMALFVASGEVDVPEYHPDDNLLGDNPRIDTTRAATKSDDQYIDILVTDGLKSFQGRMDMKNVKGRWTKQVMARSASIAASFTSTSQSQSAFMNSQLSYHEHNTSSQLQLQSTNVGDSTDGRAASLEKQQCICQFLLDDANQSMVTYEYILHTTPTNGTALQPSTLSPASRSNDITTVKMTMRSKTGTLGVRIVWSGQLSTQTDTSSLLGATSMNGPLSSTTTQSSNISAMPFIIALSQSYAQTTKQLESTRQMQARLESEVGDWKDTAMKLSEETWQKEKDELLNRFCTVLNNVKAEMKYVKEGYEETKAQLINEKRKREEYEKQESTAGAASLAMKTEEEEEVEQPSRLVPVLDLAYIQSLPKRQRKRVPATMKGKHGSEGSTDKKEVSLFGKRTGATPKVLPKANNDTTTTVTVKEKGEGKRKRSHDQITSRKDSSEPHRFDHSGRDDDETVSSVKKRQREEALFGAIGEDLAKAATKITEDKLTGTRYVWADDDTDEDEHPPPVSAAVAKDTTISNSTKNGTIKNSPKRNQDLSSDDDACENQNWTRRSRRRKAGYSPNSPKSKALSQDALEVHSTNNDVATKKIHEQPSSAKAILKCPSHTGRIIVTDKRSDATITSTPNSSPLQLGTKMSGLKKLSPAPLTSIMKSPGSASSKTSKSSLTSSTTRASAKSLTFDSSTLFKKQKKGLSPIDEQTHLSESRKEKFDVGTIASKVTSDLKKGKAGERGHDESQVDVKAAYRSIAKRMDDDTVTLNATPTPLRPMNTNGKPPSLSPAIERKQDQAAANSENKKEKESGASSPLDSAMNDNKKEKKPLDSICIHSDKLLGSEKESDDEEEDDESSSGRSEDLL